jgi:hypothetical protein
VIGDVDLRQLDRHPRASVEGLIPALSCRRCRPQAPFVRLTGLERVGAVGCGGDEPESAGEAR